jgi:glycosyltransferase involved in cell wall biosynthesis
VVDRGDVKAMADRLLLLIRDPNLRATMGRAGRSRVEALFENRKNVAEVVRLYGIGPS